MRFSPSRYLSVAWFGLLFLAALVIALPDWSLWWKALIWTLLGVVAVSGYMNMRRALFRVRWLRLHADGSLQIGHEEVDNFLFSTAGDEMPDSNKLSVVLPTVVHPWVTILRWKDGQERQFRLPVLADSLESGDFRRLRVWLRWRSRSSEPN